MGSRSDSRRISYKVDGTVLDPWPILGTLLLVVFLLTFALIVWQGRQTSRPTSHKTPTDHIVLIASPQPTPLSSPTPESSPSPSPQAQLVDTGAAPQGAQAAPAARPPAPTLRPTAAPKPTATHRAPTAILNVTPSSGPTTMTFTADASLSWDAVGIVSYQFIWGGLTDPPQTSSTSLPHRYTTPGQYTVQLIVINSFGLVSSDSRVITVY